MSYLEYFAQKNKCSGEREVMENSIGRKIKELRKSQRLTLAELSGRAGVSASFLSQIENGKQTPTVVTLKKIADALGTSVKEIFDLHQETPEYIRRCDNQSLGGLQKIYKQINVLSGKFDGRTIDAFNLVMEPGIGQVEEHSHQGEEFYLVLNGTLTVAIEGQQFVVYKDESIHFPSSVPHRLMNYGNEDLRMLGVFTPTLL